MDRFKQRVSMTGVCVLLQAWPLAPAAWEAGALAEPRVAAGPRGRGSLAARGCCAAAVTVVVESRGGLETHRRHQVHSACRWMAWAREHRVKNEEEGSDRGRGAWVGSRRRGRWWRESQKGLSKLPVLQPSLAVPCIRRPHEAGPRARHKARALGPTWMRWAVA